jgi:non-heme Fe2+,alpha-ketoglutarate-dependent halogenase
MTLSSHEVERYHASGFHFPVRVLTAAEAASYRERLDAFIAGAGGLTKAGPLLRHKAHRNCPPLAELTRHPKILDAVADVLGPDLLCWASGVFYKPAKDPSFVSWHQDAMYWGLDPADVATAWVALTDSNAGNGAMQVLPQSHRDALMPHTETYGANNMLSRGQEIAVEVDLAKAVMLTLKAGEMSLHHVKLAHGSEANRSPHARIGYAIRYVAPHVRPVTSESRAAMLVRGQDRFGHFEMERLPETEAAWPGISG